MPRRQDDSASEQDRRHRTDQLLQDAAAETDADRKRAMLDEVVVMHLPIARSIAWRFRGRGCAVEDLEQTASMALVRAVRDFDPGRGHHFLSYAVPCMTGSVKKYFRDFGWTVRPPRLVQELQQKLEGTRQNIDPVTGAKPTTAQLAETLGVDEGSVSEALQADGCFTPTSLDLTVRTGDTTIGDQLVADDDGVFRAVETRALLEPALAQLSHDERALLAMRFVEERTQQQMAEQLGTTQPAVSRSLSRILERLRMTIDQSGESAPAA